MRGLFGIHISAIEVIPVPVHLVDLCCDVAEFTTLTARNRVLHSHDCSHIGTFLLLPFDVQSKMLLPHSDLFHDANVCTVRKQYSGVVIKLGGGFSVVLFATTILLYHQFFKRRWDFFKGEDFAYRPAPTQPFRLLPLVLCIRRACRVRVRGSIGQFVIRRGVVAEINAVVRNPVPFTVPQAHVVQH